MTIQPLADRVLIEQATAEEKSVGGIILPDSAKAKNQGKVIAVGAGTKDEPMLVKAGDTVFYDQYAATEIEQDGQKYLIIRQGDILAIIG